MDDSNWFFPNKLNKNYATKEEFEALQGTVEHLLRIICKKLESVMSKQESLEASLTRYDARIRKLEGRNGIKKNNKKYF